MFNYTQDYFYVLENKINKLIKIFSICYIVLGFIYPIAAIIMKLGNLYINITILVLFTLYMGIKLFIKNKKIDITYKHVKLIIFTISLIINIYTIYIASTNVNGLAIIMSTIMTIIWVLRVVITIMFDLIKPELNKLYLCIMEDAKPLCNFSNEVTDFLHKKPIFRDMNYETPEEVKNIAKLANLASNQLKENKINKELNLNYEEIVKTIDVNQDGEITLEEYINKLLTLKNVYVNKSRFFHEFYIDKFNKEQINLLKKEKTLKNVITREDIDKFCNQLILENKKYIDIFKSYYNNENIDFKNEKEFKKILNSFSHILITMQKIIYIFGFNQLRYNTKLEDNEFYGLIDALNIALEVPNADQFKEELINIKKYSIKDKVIDGAFDVGKVIYKHKEGIATLASGYIKGRVPGLLCTGLNMIANSKNKQA